MISPESKPQVYDRVFELEVADGKKPLTSMGIVDPDLFKESEDKNELYGIMNPETCLWTFKYKRGSVPPALRGSYTGLSSLEKFARSYFTGRNINIKNVRYKDA